MTTNKESDNESMSVLDNIVYIEISSNHPTVTIDRSEIDEIGDDLVRFYLIRDLRLHDYFLETSSPGVGEEISFVSGKVKFVIEGSVLPILTRPMSVFKISRFEAVEIVIEETEPSNLSSIYSNMLINQIEEDLINDGIILDDGIEIEVAYDLQIK